MKRLPLKKWSLQEKFSPVSVIIPCFNCANTISRALDSIFQQTIKPAEVIIINDASGAATSACLHQISMRYNQLLHGWIKIIDLPQQMGPAGARNSGWQQASYRFLAFLDADDAWHPKKIEIQHAWMMANPDVAITGHHTLWLTADASPPALTNKWTASRISSIRQLMTNYFHTRSVMLRRNVPFRFNEEKKYSEDYLLWLEILFNGFKGVYMDLPLAYTFKPQYGASGLSGNLWAMEKGELDTYLRLYQKKQLSFFHLVGLIPFSLLKYAKRQMLTALI